MLLHCTREYTAVPLSVHYFQFYSMPINTTNLGLYPEDHMWLFDLWLHEHTRCEVLCYCMQIIPLIIVPALD